MAIKKYLFAGLDFIFDRDLNPWFLEANGAPQAISEFESLKKEKVITERIAGFMKGCGRELCVMANRGDTYSPDLENSKWYYHRLRAFMPDLRLCYIQDNRKNSVRLVDRRGERFRPDCIYRYHFPISRAFERRIPVINPMSVRDIVIDKLRTIRTVKRHLPHVRIPETYLVRDSHRLGKIVSSREELFGEGYVIKPVDMSLGAGVHVFSSCRERTAVRKPMLLEQRITPPLICGRYWDVRVYLFNGEFLGGMMRKSRKRVTNIAMGGTACRIPPGVLMKVRGISREIVKAIDNEACAASEGMRDAGRHDRPASMLFRTC